MEAGRPTRVQTNVGYLERDGAKHQFELSCVATGERGWNDGDELALRDEEQSLGKRRHDALDPSRQPLLGQEPVRDAGGVSPKGNENVTKAGELLDGKSSSHTGMSAPVPPRPSSSRRCLSQFEPRVRAKASLACLLARRSPRARAETRRQIGSAMVSSPMFAAIFGASRGCTRRYDVVVGDGVALAHARARARTRRSGGWNSSAHRFGAGGNDDRARASM